MEQNQKKDPKLEKLYCAVCSKQLLDEHAYKGHLQGRKHAEKVQFEERKNSSVFVSLMNVRAHRDEIKNFFASFGEVKNMILAPRYAIVEYKTRFV